MSELQLESTRFVAPNGTPPKVPMPPPACVPHATPRRFVAPCGSSTGPPKVLVAELACAPAPP
eukprot:2804694-Pyramimonas_sp.AAC.1